MSLLQGKSRARTGRRVVIDLQKAERALKEGHEKEVEQLCTDVLDERADSCLACQLLAELRFKQGRFDDSLTWIERARAIEPANPRSLNVYGRLLDRRGDLVGAEAAFRSALEADPGYADALANLGELLLRTGRGVEAEQCFRKAINHDREHGLANLSLGRILYDQRRPELAVPHLHTGIQRELTNRPAQYTLAVALHELGRLDEAITTYRRLIAAGDKDPEVYARLAEVLEATGDQAVAMAGFEAALEFQPGYPRAAAGLARLMTSGGRWQAALSLLAPLIDRGDAATCLHIEYAQALRSGGRGGEALLHLADLVKRPLPAEELAPTHRLIGDLLHAHGEYERAFAHHRRANRLTGGRYHAAGQEGLVSRLIEVFDRPSMDALPRGSSADVPVFIVGMPCSGASVLARLIASHPRAAWAGALPHVDLGAGRIGRYNPAGLPYPECVRVLRERDLRELSASYLGQLFAGREGARRVVDSMWLNFQHVGLIELMFPRARLVHLRRAPPDVGLGCYFRTFDELPDPFSGDMASIGHFYGQYLRLMDHWRSTTALPMLELDYEVLAADPEGESRRLFEFIGLSWDAACRPPRITDAGWSRNYRQHLSPLRESLAASGCSLD
jgi:tetratricopeptide (TPR) repeat protein